MSNINPGYFILSDDLDIMVKVKGYSIYHKVPFDVEAETIIHFPGGSFPDELAFLTHGNIELKLRRDVIGGAVVIPFGKKLVSNYLTANPRREYTTLPLFNLISELQIIPVPIVCNINDGIEINVEFNRIAIETLSESVTSVVHSKDIPLQVRCNVTLNQEVNLRLVAGTPSFSNELIATNYPDLGIAVKHKGQLLKPMGTSAVRLINGMASEVITVFPVKKKGQPLSGGEFNASATLLISLP
ncbi:fimbrial protein [Pantoea dispersa]|uniref:fimbrial protein n=1 Tax=Pantoea dispersa TaxID=59814 RepID=UPI0024204155|nr:fimbrial protein [Pantoea dispersa]